MSNADPTRERPASPVLPEDPPTVPSAPADADTLPGGDVSSQVDNGAPPAMPGRRKGKVSQPRRRRETWLAGCLRWLRAGLAVFLMGLAAVVATGAIVGLVIYNNLSGELAEDLETLRSMEGVEDFQTTKIYDRDGQLLNEIFAEGRRTEVSLDRIPIAMRQATIATEDDTFYENPGFDPPSIARAAWEWVDTGDIQSGGSTITQQLVRQIVFSYEERNEQTLHRKLKEAALAWVMTRQFSKDRILELYLNEIYYGNLAYGVEGAADVYFDKHASDLTVSESAFLAGMVQSPVAYDPYTNFTAAKIRQRQVLDLMARHGYLTPEEADGWFAEPPLLPSDLADPDISLIAPHFTVAVRNELAALPGMDADTIARGGLKVYTTLSQPYQTLGEEVVREQVAAISAEANLHNAALVAVNPNTGEILAMVGSVDYQDETIDGNVNVILSPQQPGSAIKPLTYAAAMEKGWTAADIVWDAPLVFPDGQGGEYEPVNYDGRFHGPARLRDALANSYNIPAVYLLHQIGVPGLLEIAERFGVQSLGTDASYYGLSLTLGGGELTPLELTSAYAVFANGGRRITPHVIARIEDSDGNLIYEAPPQPSEETLDPRIAFVISSILSDNAARAPAMGDDSPLQLSFPAAAKTGTTNEFRDNWTVGYTPHLVVGVWAGNTDNSAMAEGTSGLTGAAPIWHEYMEQVYADPEKTALLTDPALPPLRSEFAPPPKMEQRQVCALSSLKDPAPAAEGCTRLRAEWFLQPEPEDLLRTPTIGNTPTWTPRPTIEGQPEATPLPYVRLSLEKGIWILGVLPLDEAGLAALGPSIEALNRDRPEGVPPLAAPKYCEVPQDRADTPGLVFQLFIEPPPDPGDAIRARNWALGHDAPIMPGIACPAEAMLTPTPAVTVDPVFGATYYISYPIPGQGVYGVLPILGTAIFDRTQVQFYKIEISGGAFTEWATLGEIHFENVQDAVLEILHADALPPGDYLLRLVLVQIDGNYVQPPFEVPIRVLSEPLTPTPSAEP